MSDIARVEPERRLVSLEQARHALTAMTNIEDVIELRDVAETVRRHREISNQALDVCNEAAEVKLWAERRIGELLAAMPKSEGQLYRGHTMLPRDEATPSLADLGIHKMQSHRWQALATLPEDVFEEHIRTTKEAGEQLTTAGMLRVVKGRAKTERQQTVRSEAAESVVSLDTLISDGKKFGTVYADPPWLYGNQRTRGATGDHYDGMTVEEIAALPVHDLLAADAHLHLWTTNAFLPDAFGIIEAWGFEYKSLFVWMKPQMGMGNYWRVSTEYLLLGVCGSCSFAVHDVINYGVFDRGAHSAKPEQVRFLIERASPGPYLELFGRKAVAGWTVFGNQVERDLFTTKEEAS